MRLVAFVPDLMDRSRFGPVALEKKFVRAVDDLPAAIEIDDVVVVDLSRPGALEALSALEGVRKIGFVSHEDASAMAAAKLAGIETFPRSRFFSHIVEIMAKETH